MLTFWLKNSESFTINYSQYLAKIPGIIASSNNETTFYTLPKPISTNLESISVLNNDNNNDNDNEKSRNVNIDSLLKNSNNSNSSSNNNNNNNEDNSNGPLLSTASTFLNENNKITTTYAELCSFEYDVLSIKRENHYEICALVMLLFSNTFILESIDVDKTILMNYITRVSRNYKEVPYHNFHHAFCVVQFTVALLVQCDIRKYNPPEKELFGLVISSLIHDIDHHGLNNSFAVRTSSKLAIVYNDVSVLENHHIALGFSIMQSSKEFNILAKWSKQDCINFRKLTINCILSTDMALHNDMCREMSTYGLNSQTFDVDRFKVEADRFNIYRYFLHGADISNSVRPHHISYQISLFIAEEFRNQAKQEMAIGLDVTPFMILPDDMAIAKGEIGFLEYVAKPFWVSLGLSIDKVTVLSLTLNKNIDGWKKRLQSITDGQELDRK